MAGSDAQNPALVRVWSDAVFALAEKQGVADDLLAEWTSLVDLFDAQPGLETLLASPLVGDDEKKELLERLFRGKASDLLLDSLQVMRSKGRLGIVRAVARTFRDTWLEKRQQIEVRVTSARALTPEQRQAVGGAASKFTGRQAILIEEVDPALLGGFVLRAGDRRFDGSVARELERVEEILLARASRELLSGHDSISNEESSQGV
ncbi:MAG: ATP synthase F1 subunit delta [Thermoanaerobaculia bacterium]